MANQLKNVLITGASSGFGFMAAKAFADSGYKVWASMRATSGKNAAAKAELESYSSAIGVVDFDVTDGASIAKAVTHIIAVDGKIDILINNAGIMNVGVTEAYSLDQARAQMETNYFGLIQVSQAVLPHMRAKRSGLVINTSSAVGRLVYPFLGTYAATKFAVEAYSQSLRYELAPFGVDVAVVEPGPFGTNLVHGIQAEDRKDVKADYGEIGTIPEKMLGAFGALFSSPDAPQPQWVVEAYLALADAPAGTRPLRVTVGHVSGADEINALAQPIQDRILDELQLADVLGGKSA